MLPKKGPKNTPTFSLEGQLPKFPLPEVADTLRRYRRAALPFCASPEDVDRLDRQLKEAGEELKPIQDLLVKRREETDAYVHDVWWSKYGYLEDRSPITPIESTPLDFGWSEEVNLLGHPVPKHLRAALIIRNAAAFHAQLESEQHPALGHAPDQPISMHQFRSLFSCVRIPKAEFDEQVRFFHTSTERKRTERRHIIVGVRGRLYKLFIDGVNLLPLSVGALEAAVRRIETHAFECGLKPNEFREVGFLTGSKRDWWADAREALIQSDAQNYRVLDEIGRAIFFVTLDEASPDSNQQCLIDLSISPDGGSRWYDKSSQFVVFKNSKSGFSMEHSVMDAAGQLSMHEFCDGLYSAWIRRAHESKLGIEEFARVEARGDVKDAQFEWLQWGKVPERAFELLNLAKTEYLQRLPTVWKLRYARLRGLGRNFCKEVGVSSDSFCQMAFQDTFFRLHGRLPSTYESVGVLRFRLGRTETGRCASLESKEFVEHSKRASSSDADLKALGESLRKACAYHEEWIKEASEGRGFDRHLFAIRCMCRENGLKVPEFLNDPVFARASKWDLSTSNAFVAGNLQAFQGGTTFRPVSPESLGVVYCIGGDYIDLTVMSVDDKFDSEAFLQLVATRFGVLSKALVVSKKDRSSL